MSHNPAHLDGTAHPGQPTADEFTAHCFGCGPANPQGLHLHFTLSSENPSADPLHPSATALVNPPSSTRARPDTSTAASSPPSSTRP